MDRNKVYTQNNLPEKDPKGDGRFSYDVIARSTKSGMLHLAFYDYEDEEWGFHNDTMEDVRDFKWMYAPEALTQ